MVLLNENILPDNYTQLNYLNQGEKVFTELCIVLCQGILEFSEAIHLRYVVKSII